MDMVVFQAMRAYKILAGGFFELLADQIDGVLVMAADALDGLEFRQFDLQPISQDLRQYTPALTAGADGVESL